MPGRRPVPSWLSACCRRSGDRATRRRVGVISGQSRHRACSPSALGFPAPPRRCCEGRREPSVGDPMKHRRSTTSALAGSSASSWWHSAWGGRRRRRIRQAKEIESRVRRCGRRRPRRPPRKRPVSRKGHPRARQAGTMPSRDQHTTTRRRRRIMLRSRRMAIPHQGRTQPSLDPTQSGDPTHRMPSGGISAQPRTRRPRPPTRKA